MRLHYLQTVSAICLGGITVILLNAAVPLDPPRPWKLAAITFAFAVLLMTTIALTTIASRDK